MCENLCMKISYSLCVQAVKPEKAPDSFCNFTSLEYNIKSVADTMYFRKTNKNRSERGGSPTGKEGYTNEKPINIVRLCQLRNRLPKMERKIGL